ncbi:MAG: Fic family protein [Candidatus Cryptobacteroides sp.]
MTPYDRNIPYNSLPGLPPEESLYQDATVIQKLAEASRKLAELKGIASMLPNQSIFVNTIALREAKASSAIENIFTTDDELYKALTYQDDDYVQGPAKEILHYREALWKGFAEIVKNGELTVNTIIEIYRQIKQTQDGIRPYQAEIVIKKRGWGSLIGETVYTPPRGPGIVEKLLNDLVEFLNDDTKFPVDPLMKMAMAHYQFEAIHPFRDGNGRTGRIICLLYLIQKGLLEVPILYMSAYILQNKDKYYFNLSNVTGTQNWRDWLIFMMETVIQTSEYTIYKIKKICALISKTEGIIRGQKSSIAKIEIPKLFGQPYIRPKNLLSDKIRSVNTAKKHLTALEGLGLLTKSKIGKEFVWFNTELMDILSAED